MPTSNSFLEIRERIIKSLKYHICLCKGAAIITGFAYTQWFVDNAVVGILITYLTDVWKDYNLANGVGVTNLQEGFSSVLVLATTYISKNDHVSPLRVIICSAAAYIIGMVMLCISAFHRIPVGKATMYFVPAVLLISVGKSGDPILENFLVDQLKAHEPRQPIEKDRVEARKNMWWITASIFCTILTPLIYGKVHADFWFVTFVSSTSVMAFGYLLFLCCIPLYHSSGDEAARTSEISRASPEENTNNGPSRSADEATGITSEISSASPKENTSSGPTTPAVSAAVRRLAEKLKPLFRMIPMWTTYLVFGLVLSTGDTFFTDQGNNMKPTVSIYILIMFRKIIKFTTSYLSKFLFKRLRKPQRTKGIMVGIWIAMVVSVLCCFVAWRFEIRRMGAIEESAICVSEDADNIVIPMSIMGLAPQFCLLGLMEGIGKQGLDLFFEIQVPDSRMEVYGSALNEAVIGFGSFANAFLVFCLKSWFPSTLNCSHLEDYYYLLVILTTANAGCYVVVSTFYWDDNN